MALTSPIHDVTGRGGVVDKDVTEALVVSFSISGDDEGVEGMIYGSDVTVTGRVGVVDNDVTEAMVVGFCVFV